MASVVESDLSWAPPELAPYAVEALFDTDDQLWNGFITGGPGIQEGDVIHFQAPQEDDLALEALRSLRVYLNVEPG